MCVCTSSCLSASSFFVLNWRPRLSFLMYPDFLYVNLCMSMYVFMYVCVCMPMYVYIYIYLCQCLYVGMQARLARKNKSLFGNLLSLSSVRQKWQLLLSRRGTCTYNPTRGIQERVNEYLHLHVWTPTDRARRGSDCFSFFFLSVLRLFRFR